MKCVRCGTELKEGDKFCLGCGFEVGKEYIPEPKAETLESIMEIPEEKEEKEPAEEMEINDSLKETEMIDGNAVNVEYNVGESSEKVKKSRKVNYIILGICAIVVVLGLTIYFNFKKITCLFKDCSPAVIVKPDDKKNNVINHPTTTYSFDSKFLFRLNDLWTAKSMMFSENVKSFEKDTSEFTLTKYVLDENTVSAYLKYIGEESSDSLEINKITYSHVQINNKEEYIIASKNAVYVFSFTETSNEDKMEILNTVVYYK